MRLTALWAAMAVWPTVVVAGHVSFVQPVPHGMYVHSFNPPCGIPNTFAQSLDRPEIIAATAKAFGPQAAGVVVAVTVADKMAAEHGGALGKLWNRAAGRKDGASCATFCVRTPRNVKPTTIDLSNSAGTTIKTLPFRDGVITHDAWTGDWSGWRDVVSAHSEHRWYVCATAANWQHNATATKRLQINYR